MTAARFGLALVLALLVDVSSASAQKTNEATKAGVDAYGDPLPAGATARIGTVRLRHAGAVTYVKFGPDGKRIVSAGEDGTVRLWDVAAGKELGRFTGSKPCLSPDGKTLVTWDQGLRGWDLTTGMELAWSSARPGNADFRIMELAISTDGSFVTIAGDLMPPDFYSAQTAPPSAYPPPMGKVQCWSLATGKLIHEHKEAARGHSFRVAPDGMTVMYVDYENTHWHVYESATGKMLQRWPLHGNPWFLPGGLRLFGTVLAPGTPLEWTWVAKEVATGKELFRIQPKGNEVVACSPKGEIVAAADRELPGGPGIPTIEIRETIKGKTLHKLAGEPVGTFWMLFTPNAKQLITVDNHRGFRVWDTATGRMVWSMDKSGYATTLDISADSTLMATNDGHSPMIVIWKLETGDRMTNGDAPSYPGQAMCFSPDGKELATIDVGGAWVCLAATGNKPRRVPGYSPKDRFGGLLHGSQEWNDHPLLAWDQRGHVLLMGITQTDRNRGPQKEPPEGLTQLVDISAGKRILYLDKANTPLWNGAASADGKKLAGVMENRICLWDIGSGKEYAKMNGEVVTPQNLGLALSPNGKTVAARGFRDPTKGRRIEWVWVWEVATGNIRHRWEWDIASIGQESGRRPGGITALHRVPLASLAFSPDGQSLALASEDAIVLLGLDTGKEIRQFGGKDVKSATAAFSPDGKLLAALTGPGSICLWEVATGTLLRRVNNPPAKVVSFCFSPDGKTLAAANSDTTVLLWDVKQLLASDNTPHPAATMNAFWQQLASDDATLAGKAIMALSKEGPATVAMLNTTLKPIAPPDPKLIPQLLADLDSNKYAVREKALHDLEELGDIAVPALQKLREGQPPLETKQRVTILLKKMEGPVRSPEVLRMLRAIEVLERIGSVEARQVLEELAKGLPGHRVTVSAQEAATRLRVRYEQ